MNEDIEDYGLPNVESEPTLEPVVTNFEKEPIDVSSHHKPNVEPSRPEIPKIILFLLGIIIILGTILALILLGIIPIGSF